MSIPRPDMPWAHEDVYQVAKNLGRSRLKSSDSVWISLAEILSKNKNRFSCNGRPEPAITTSTYDATMEHRYDPDSDVGSGQVVEWQIRCCKSFSLVKAVPARRGQPQKRLSRTLPPRLRSNQIGPTPREHAIEVGRIERVRKCSNVPGKLMGASGKVMKVFCPNLMH